MVGELEAGRAAYRRRAWADAYRLLASADQAGALGVQDLEWLATSAYLTGRDAECLACHERAFHAHQQNAESASAARCAFWLGLMQLFRGEAGQAGGWFARARRLLEGRDCVELGYLLVPAAEQQLRQGDMQSAASSAANAVAIGVRFADPDLTACARHVQGRVLIQRGDVAAGLALLDEAMLAVVAGELSPVMTGLIYCSVIDGCRDVHALSRAMEWTEALARWCEAQPEMVAFTGTCLVHRAEILQLRGAWDDALAEAQRASERLAGVGNRLQPAAALYRQAEVFRLRGEFAAAEQAYHDARRSGAEPQPGLALMRINQGNVEAACAAIRRVLDATTDSPHRARLLPAYIEIMLAAGDIESARSAARELEDIAATLHAEVLHAMAAQARGEVELACNDARAAIAPLRRALELWQRIEAPYESARVRVLMGLACRSLGDAEAGALDLDAARAAFERLGAAPDLARLESLRTPVARQRHLLTARELQVLRLVAAGKTNKAIAHELSLSERTIDRHVSNIFSKLDVPSRAAATAYAYDHKLF